MPPDREDAERGQRPEQPRVGLDLHDQFARGRDNEHARGGARARGRFGGTEQAGKPGDQEGGRLAGPRL
jgi:hypothetical protein